MVAPRGAHSKRTALQPTRQCAIGKQQSPIDIPQKDAVGNLTVKTDDKPGRLSLNPDDHTVEVAAPTGSSMTVAAKTYKLVQVHFHSPSEHKIAGKSFPFEAHFVQRNEAGELAVLGVLFEVGRSNGQLEQILREAKGDNYDGKIGIMTFDPNGLLPADLKVFNCPGSLTTPPCSEGVNWNVVVARMTVSADEPIVFETYMHGKNARAVQPLNGR
jgi:carbonic anhydrase